MNELDKIQERLDNLRARFDKACKNLMDIVGNEPEGRKRVRMTSKLGKVFYQTRPTKYLKVRVK